MDTAEKKGFVIFNIVDSDDWKRPKRPLRKESLGKALEIRFKMKLSKLGRYAWVLHNIISHPLSEVLFQLKLEKASNWVHDVTIPEHEEGKGRG